MKAKNLKVAIRLGDKVYAEVQSSLLTEPITIGRAEDNDWMCPEGDRTMRLKHAELRRDSRGRLVLAALGGAQLRYQGEPCRERKLAANDVIALGDSELVVSVVEEKKLYAPFHRLEALDASAESTLKDIDRDDFLIGSAADAALVLDDGVVSKHHARLRLVEGGVEIFDLSSRNGTIVNGDRLGGKGRLLADGDLIEIGSFRFRFLDQAVDHVRSELGRNILIATLTLIAAAGLWAAWFFTSPAAVDYYQLSLRQAREREFDRASEALTKASNARGYANLKTICEEFEDRLSVWRTTSAVWEEFKNHLLNAEWHDAYEATGRMNPEVVSLWDWDTESLSERVEEIREADYSISALGLLMMALDDPAWTDDQNSRLEAFIERLGVRKPDYLKNETRDWMLSMKRRITELIGEFDANEKRHQEIVDLIDKLEPTSERLDEIEKTIDRIAGESRGHVRIFARRLKVPFASMKGDILMLAKDREAIASLDFTHWKGEDLKSNPNDYNLTPGLERVYHQLVEDRARISRFAAEILAIVSRYAGDFGFTEKDDPPSLLDFENRKAVENVLECGIFKEPRVPRRDREKPVDDYDRLVGFEYLWNYMVQGAYVYPDMLMTEDLASQKFLPSLYSIEEFLHQTIRDQAVLANPVYADLITGKLKVYVTRLEDCVKRYWKVKAFFHAVASDPKETYTRRGVIADAIDIYLTPHKDITKEDWQRFTERNNKLRTEWRKLSESLNPARPEEARETVKKIKSIAIPGSPITKKLWSYK